METNEAVESNLQGNDGVRKQGSLRITNRDLEILQFILEMKFASLIDIKKKFFRFTKEGKESLSLWWAYERTQQLLKSGFIVDDNEICKEKLYLITEKGFYYLQNSYPSAAFCKPIHSVDIRTFNHDRTVNKVRIDLENYRKVTRWQSERALTEIQMYRTILPKEFRPDAVYTNRDGLKVAFEMEISQKANERYDNKILKFLEIVRADEKLRLFDKIHYVCANDAVLRKLKDKTQLFKSFFQVESVSDIKEEQIL